MYRGRLRIVEDKQSPDRQVEKAPPVDWATLDASVDRVPQPKGEFKNLFQGTPPKNEGSDTSSGNKGNSNK